MSATIEALRTSAWTGFILRKFGSVVFAFLVLVVLTFIMVLFIPGDPARSIAGSDASADELEDIRAELGLTDPLPIRFLHYMTRVFGGGLGQSFRTSEPVTDILAARLPFTLSVSLAAIAVTLVVAVTLGLVVAALTKGNRRQWLDMAFSWVTALGGSVPQYVVGALLVLVFAVTLRVLPAAGANSLASYVLPVTALSIGPICAVSRVVRREAQSVLEQDYMRTARGWRVGVVKQYLKYALPNLVTSTLTLTGLILAGMLGGAIIMENIFAWPGLGRGLVEGILQKDYPVIQGIILVLGVIAILLHTAIDFLLAIIDPRTLRAGKGQH